MAPEIIFILKSHVIPALIYRFHDGKVRKASAVDIWGIGNANREFLFVNIWHLQVSTSYEFRQENL